MRKGGRGREGGKGRRGGEGEGRGREGKGRDASGQKWPVRKPMKYNPNLAGLLQNSRSCIDQNSISVFEDSHCLT